MSLFDKIKDFGKKKQCFLCDAIIDPKSDYSYVNAVAGYQTIKKEICTECSKIFEEIAEDESI